MSVLLPAYAAHVGGLTGFRTHPFTLGKNDRCATCEGERLEHLDPEPSDLVEFLVELLPKPA